MTVLNSTPGCSCSNETLCSAAIYQNDPHVLYRKCNLLWKSMPSGKWLTMCLVPKCGVTRWTQLQAHILRGHWSLSFSLKQLITVPNFNLSRILLSADSFDQPPIHIKPSSFVWLFPVRNPYERLLSGYLDKVAQKDRQIGMKFHRLAKDVPTKWNATAEMFEQFVTLLAAYGAGWSDKRYWGTLNAYTRLHFYPIARNPHSCVANALAAHASSSWLRPRILRIEQMALWYPALVHELGIRKAVSDKSWKGGCFFKPAQSTCESALIDSASRHGELRAFGTQEQMEEHAHNSAGQLLSYYTRSLCARVTDLFRVDLDRFGYAEWKGENGTVPWAGLPPPDYFGTGDAGETISPRRVRF